MDQLLDSLTTDWVVTTTPCSTLPPRFEMYKKKPCMQDERRKEFLTKQRNKRYDAFQHARNLAHGFTNVPKPAPKQSRTSEAPQEPMEADDEIERPSTSYANQLMLSEWLLEVPLDLREYIVVICPKGKRALLIASRGITKLYTRNGYCFHTFASNLPGGSIVSRRQPNWKPDEFTILDVVYSEEHNTLYLLDLIAWRSSHYYDSETEFRFYWLKTQFDECSKELTQTQRKIRIELVNRHEYDPQHLEDVLMASKETLPQFTGFAPPIDGILFYHRQVHYLPGKCPLVGWLKPSMITDKLGIPCHERYAQKRQPMES